MGNELQDKSAGFLFLDIPFDPHSLAPGFSNREGCDQLPRSVFRSISVEWFGIMFNDPAGRIISIPDIILVG